MREQRVGDGLGMNLKDLWGIFSILEEGLERVLREELEERRDGHDSNE